MIPSDLFDEEIITVAPPRFRSWTVQNVSKNFPEPGHSFSNEHNLKSQMMKLIAPVSPLARVVAQPECLTNTLDRYEFVAKIGEGSFGSVGEYLDRKNRFARVAIKTIAASERDTFVQECEILSQLRSNAHVTSMLHSFEENRKCYLVMKRADRTLARLIQETGPMDLQTTVHIARQIALGLEGLHGLGWTHTDLKPDNVVVYDNMHAQLIDFGCCMKNDVDAPSGVPVDSEGNYYVTTRWYRAPETVLATPNVIGQKIDIWSLGCVIVQMLTSFVLFPASDEEELLAMMEIFLGPIPRDVLRDGANTSFLYARRADASVRSIPDLKKPNAHRRTRWLKYTKSCWTQNTDAFETSEYVSFTRLDQSHIFDGLELQYFQRTVNWSAYLNMLYLLPEDPDAVKLRHVIRATLVFDAGSRASAETVVDMLSDIPSLNDE